MTRNRFVRVGILVVVTAVVSVATFVPLGASSSSTPRRTPSPAIRHRAQRPALAPHHCIVRVPGDDIATDDSGV
jgi:hypothetical protein